MQKPAYEAPRANIANVELIKQAVIKSRLDFANRQKLDLEEVLKQSEHDYLTSMLQQVEDDETKQVIAQSIREQQAKEDEEFKQLENDFFASFKPAAAIVPQPNP